MHRLFWQSAATVQDDPIGRAVVHRCMVGSQFGAAAVQSALVAHVARQAVWAALQLRPSGHALTAAAAQEPAPSQNRADVSVLPLQLGAAQLTVGLAGTQAAVVAAVGAHWAAQTPVPPQGARDPCGGPELTAKHAPRLGEMSHA